MIKRFLEKCGYVKKSELDAQLDYAFSIGKRLDEHREVVEAIEQKTDLLTSCEWHISHLATTDDLLLRIYYIAHGHWPNESNKGEGCSIRSRPEILGECGLPEYKIDKGT